MPVTLLKQCWGRHDRHKPHPKRRKAHAESPVVATELVGTSITSQGPPYDLIAEVLPDNPHVRFFESRKRGYVSVDLDGAKMTARMRAVSDVADPKAGVSTLTSFVIENGKPGVVGA
jgi:alkaline phosphatase D